MSGEIELVPGVHYNTLQCQHEYRSELLRGMNKESFQRARLRMVEESCRAIIHKMIHEGHITISEETVDPNLFYGRERITCTIHVVTDKKTRDDVNAQLKAAHLEGMREALSVIRPWKCSPDWGIKGAIRDLENAMKSRGSN